MWCSCISYWPLEVAANSIDCSFLSQHIQLENHAVITIDGRMFHFMEWDLAVSGSVQGTPHLITINGKIKYGMLGRDTNGNYFYCGKMHRSGYYPEGIAGYCSGYYPEGIAGYCSSQVTTHIVRWRCKYSFRMYSGICKHCQMLGDNYTVCQLLSCASLDGWTAARGIKADSILNMTLLLNMQVLKWITR